MNYFDLYSSYPDRTIAAAWDSQIKEADKTPWLAGTLTECGDELFARFAACYAELRALPRGARRTLQRQLARSSELAAILPEYLQHGGRRLQHRMAWSLAGAALLLALGQGVATAATITVTTNDPRIIPDGQCSLVEAIVNANNDAATHADCPAGSGPDTIVLPANTNVTLSNAAGTTQYGSPVGLPLITSRITIEGNGATIHREGTAPAFGLMAVRGDVFLGVGVPPMPGGDLTLQRVILSGGSSSGGGGGVGNSGTLSIKNSTISGNTANGAGGGIDNYYGTLTIENSTISGNTSTSGGGVNNCGGRLNIENSTISGNTSNFAGGGVSNNPCSYYSSVDSAIITITNSTISGNRANQGGGVFNSQFCHGNPSFPGYDHCHTAALTLNRSLIAGNQAATGPEIENSKNFFNFMGPPPLNNVNANNFNLFGANGNAGVSGFSPGPTDIVSGVPLAQILGPLQNNGGQTQTHALVAGSPAIDAGDPGGCRDNSGSLLATDQRGFSRHVDGNHDGTVRCDIGAVEFGAGSATLIDFDGDGKTDQAVYRDGVWFILRSSDGGGMAITWGGAPQDIPVPGDYDGDGKVDQAVYRDGVWWILPSGMAITWGGAPQDIPVPGDFDGDGKTDQAVYRDGVWFILRSSDSGGMGITWGGALQDIPVPGDFDGDGKTDQAVYRDGVWFILRSSDSGGMGITWGGALQDIPVPGDFDGDGKTDQAVYRDGVWFILRSSDGGGMALTWGGAPQDIPVPGDFDGDGKVDQAVYRDGVWFILRSSDSGGMGITWGGAPQDVPLK